jgi:hypothetical protein
MSRSDPFVAVDAATDVPGVARTSAVSGRPRMARVGPGPTVDLGVRQAEILALLALHPAGLTCEQLTLELYGEEGNRISTRAQISRLRRALGPLLAARPYRLLADVNADFPAVERLVRDGDVAARRLRALRLRWRAAG